MASHYKFICILLAIAFALVYRHRYHAAHQEQGDQPPPSRVLDFSHPQSDSQMDLQPDLGLPGRALTSSLTRSMSAVSKDPSKTTRLSLLSFNPDVFAVEAQRPLLAPGSPTFLFSNVVSPSAASTGSNRTQTEGTVQGSSADSDSTGHSSGDRATPVHEEGVDDTSVRTVSGVGSAPGSASVSASAIFLMERDRPAQVEEGDRIDPASPQTYPNIRSIHEPEETLDPEHDPTLRSMRTMMMGGIDESYLKQWSHQSGGGSKPSSRSTSRLASKSNSPAPIDRMGSHASAESGAESDGSYHSHSSTSSKKSTSRSWKNFFKKKSGSSDSHLPTQSPVRSRAPSVKSGNSQGSDGGSAGSVQSGVLNPNQGFVGVGDGVPAPARGTRRRSVSVVKCLDDFDDLTTSGLGSQEKTPSESSDSVGHPTNPSSMGTPTRPSASSSGGEEVTPERHNTVTDLSSSPRRRLSRPRAVTEGQHLPIVLDGWVRGESTNSLGSVEWTQVHLSERTGPDGTPLAPSNSNGTSSEEVGTSTPVSSFSEKMERSTVV